MIKINNNDFSIRNQIELIPIATSFDFVYEIVALKWQVRCLIK